MSVSPNHEGYFQEYQPNDIAYTAYNVREIVARQHRESLAFLSESRPAPEPEPCYPPLRDIGVLSDAPAAREIMVQDAVAALTGARVELADSVMKVGRLRTEDLTRVKRYIDRLGAYMRTLERRGRV